VALARRDLTMISDYFRSLKAVSKNTARLVLYRIVGRPFYSLIKRFYSPPASWRTRLRFIGKFKVRTKDGKSFYLYNAGFQLESNIYWSGLDNCNWEPMSRDIWTHLSTSASTIFDIGSNSGLFAVLAKTYHPEASVVAFEPQPNIFKVLRTNNDINGFDIHCNNIALSDEEGEVPFYNYGATAFTRENTTAGSLNKHWRPDGQTSIRVKAKELRTFIAENNIKTIDLMKIDVETFEYEVLSGYGEYLFLHEPIVLLEIQDRAIGKRIESLFQKTSYSFFNIDEASGLRQVEGLGTAQGDLNYLLCPVSKLDRVRRFIT
jgi:FkbM family methyltransferase